MNDLRFPISKGEIGGVPIYCQALLSKVIPDNRIRSPTPTVRIMENACAFVMLPVPNEDYWRSSQLSGLSQGTRFNGEDELLCKWTWLVVSTSY
jgi:hypothetical protein